MLFLVIKTYKSANGLGGHRIVTCIEDESQIQDTITDLLKKMDKKEVKGYTEDMNLVLFMQGVYNIANIPEAKGLSEEEVIKLIDDACDKVFDEVLDDATNHVMDSLMAEYFIVDSRYAEIREGDLFRFIDR